MSRTVRVSEPEPASPPAFDWSPAGLKTEIEALKGELGRVQQQLEQMTRLVNARPPFTQDDNAFLIFVLGFTAGAHLDKDGSKGERIFAWCRTLQEKLQQQMANPS